jgi:basic membrane protein A
MVFDKGGRGDKSFNDSAAAGLDKAKAELGIEVKELQSKEEKDYEANLGLMVEEGCDLIIGVGINMQKAMEQAAKANPDAKFAIVDAPVDQPNVKTLLFNEEEGSFLAGYLAGLMTQSKKVGFVGGQEIPLIGKFYSGFAAGVKTANPLVEVLPDKYTGDWNNVDRGKAIAQTLFAAGADIVYHAAGKAGLGVIKAAEESKKLAIGVDSDQDDQAPGFVLTSMMKRVDVAVYETIKELKDGSFSAGTRVFDLKAGGVGLSEMKFTKDKVGEANLAKVKEVSDKVTSGEIKVPTTKDELAAYVAGLNK